MQVVNRAIQTSPFTAAHDVLQTCIYGRQSMLGGSRFARAREYFSRPLNLALVVFRHNFRSRSSMTMNHIEYFSIGGKRDKAMCEVCRYATQLTDSLRSELRLLNYFMTL